MKYLESFLPIQIRLQRCAWYSLGCIKNGLKTAPQPIALSGHNAPPFKPAFPEFTAGAGYVIPGRRVPELYLESTRVKFLPVEDVFTTGFTAKRIGLGTVHDRRFSCGEMVRGDKLCQMADKFNGHKVTPELQSLLMSHAENGFQECR